MTRFTIPMIAFALLVAFMSTASESFAADVDFTGTWKSDKYGTCTMIQNGDRVEGKMVYPNGGKGNLVGAIANRTLKFEWAHSSGLGTGELIMSVSGSTLTGFWVNSKNGDKDDWVLKKVP